MLIQTAERFVEKRNKVQKLAQSTQNIDWKNIELIVYSLATNNASGYVCLPLDNGLRPVSVQKKKW